MKDLKSSINYRLSKLEVTVYKKAMDQIHIDVAMDLSFSVEDYIEDHFSILTQSLEDENTERYERELRAR